MGNTLEESYIYPHLVHAKLQTAMKGEVTQLEPECRTESRETKMGVEAAIISRAEFHRGGSYKDSKRARILKIRRGVSQVIDWILFSAVHEKKTTWDQEKNTGKQ